MPFNTLKAILSGKAKLEDVKGKEYIMVKLISFGDVRKSQKRAWRGGLIDNS